MNEQKLREILEHLVGAASMCWEDVGKAGAFNSDMALRLVELALQPILTLAETSKTRTRWNQEAITKWSSDTFGEVRSNLSIAVRANEEMAELLTCLSLDDNDPHARVEVADVIITLCRLVSRLGGSMARDVHDKMEVNVKRKWRSRGNGVGEHVKEGEQSPSSPQEVRRCQGTFDDGHYAPIIMSCSAVSGCALPGCPFEQTWLKSLRQ